MTKDEVDIYLSDGFYRTVVVSSSTKFLCFPVFVDGEMSVPTNLKYVEPTQIKAEIVQSENGRRVCYIPEYDKKSFEGGG